MNIIIANLLDGLRYGDIQNVYNKKEYLNSVALELYSKQVLTDQEILDLKNIVYICNITYNDTDKELLPIEDGIYDLLLEKYKTYDPNFQVGAEVLNFKASKQSNTPFVEMQSKDALIFNTEKDDEFMSSSLFSDNILVNESAFIDQRDINSYYQHGQRIKSYVSKRKHDTSHEHPELVGTLDKCKFVLNKDAVDRGVFNDSNVKIFERDFFQQHVRMGLIDQFHEFGLVFELKYDGVSVEADCTDEVVSARSRGDTGMDKASDLTPLLKGYRFPHRKPGSPMVGVKFEAIITNYDLMAFNRAKNYNYRNCRSAIVGLLASSDAYKYRDFITLVPLAVEKKVFETECGSNRVNEIEYLNREFVSKGCPLRYSYLYSNYVSQLYSVKRFVDEAEYCRKWIPFMYDGVVVSYIDKNIRDALGRENYINKFSIAIKFNPLKKQTIFRGYTYTIGQDGSVTPMIHYDPVEFYGTIHSKSSGHSYSRFMELRLHLGDIIDIEYVNDVMPYVSKSMNQHNIQNESATPMERFPEKCPVCGNYLTISPSGKSVKCTNVHCGGRSLSRMVNMCAKLNMDGFGEATIAKLNVYTFKDLADTVTNQSKMKSIGFGDLESANLFEEVSKILHGSIREEVFLGSLGFDNVSNKTWELILSKLPYDEFKRIIETDTVAMANILKSIKGIGVNTADTIIDEYPYFKNDIDFLRSTNPNIIKYIKLSGKKIRATGFRDKALFEMLRTKYNCDADDNGSLTKDTDILLVPSEDHKSTKTAKAISYGVQIVPVHEFLSNIDKYL